MNTARPRKSLGQHFLHDPNVLARIIDAIAPSPDEHFVEIGPGRGALTIPLAARVRRLDAIEKDRALAAALSEVVGDERLVVHQADALKFDYTSLGPGPLRIAGNLPYNISTPLLFRLLAHAPRIRDMHLMLQREVVNRMTAAPGTKQYGRLTVALAARCEVRLVLRVGPGAFTPPPRVDSAVARLVPDPARRREIHDERLFDELVARAFSQRRKRLSNALKGFAADELLAQAGIDPGARAGEIDPPRYVRAANALAAARASVE